MSTPDWFSMTPRNDWLAAASQSFSLKQAVQRVGVVAYPAWSLSIGKYDPPLKDEMRTVFGTAAPTALCRTGCGRPARSQRRASTRMLCAPCDRRARAGGVVGPEGDRTYTADRQCDVGGCGDGQYAKGLCNLHWQRLRAWGRTGGPGRLRENWRLRGFTTAEMKAAKEWMYGRRDDRPQTDEGMRNRVDYEVIIQNDPCVYCGGPAGEVEHIEPYSRGGSPEWDNLAPACRSCNSSKHATKLLVYLLNR